MEPTFWDEASLNSTIKCESGNAGPSNQVKEDQSFLRYVEGNLNFATVASEDDDYGYHKKKLSRDPLSHRIIEKRRRDRMNNCLADLSRLLPSEYMKKGRGRIEKTEIIEMAIKHMKHLQSHPCTEGGCCPVIASSPGTNGSPDHHNHLGVDGGGGGTNGSSPQGGGGGNNHQGGGGGGGPSVKAEHYRLGFHDCLSETMHFLVEVEGFFAGDTLCVQLVSHLHRHCDSVLKGQERLSGGLYRGGSQKSNVGGGGGSLSTTGNNNGVQGGNTLNQNLGRNNCIIKEEGVIVDKNELSPSPLSSNHFPNGGGEGSTNSSPSPQSQGSVESSGNGVPLPSYKFKNNIRKRFASEKAKDSHPLFPQYSHVGPGGVPASSFFPQGSNNGRTASNSPRTSGNGIPVFALSPKGTYYVPLTLDYPLISPHLSLAEPPDEEEEPVLHPVAISVNFRPRSRHS